jgi:hypothetical protein
MFTRTLTLMLALSACKTAEPGVPVVDPDIVLPPTLGNLDPTGDEDGDGLSNQDEITGTVISVNETGYPGQTLDYEVYSDPTLADTDGDGLDDAEERSTRTDPGFVDTDGDGLNDWEEARFWATSPTSVDSDGDAVGTDGVPRAPNPRLFDGAELDLVADTLQLGTPGIPGVGATSPLHADTDGDTLSDWEELDLLTRSPVIAEVVSIELQPTPRSVFEIALHAEYTDGTVDTESLSVSHEFEEGITTSVATEVSQSVTASVDAYVWEEITLSVGCCLDIYNQDVEVGFGLETSLTTESNHTATFSGGVSFDYTDTEAEARALEESQEATLTGGRIRMSMDVRNTGPVATRVADLGVVLRYLDPTTGARVVLGELTPVDAQGEVLLAPGEAMTLQLENLDLPLDPVRRVMAAPSALSFNIARYDLRDATGQDYDFLYEQVPERTAVLTLVRPSGVQQFYVAADVFTDADGERYGVSLADALASLGIDYAAVTNADGDVAISIDGITSELHTTPPPDLQAGGGDRFGYPATGGPGARSLKRGWVGMLGARDPSKRDVFYTDFFQARMRPGDVMTLLLDEDLDQDGVPRMEEIQYGSSDLNIHTDGLELGDGLSDFFEIREGWEVETQQLLAYAVFSHPGRADTDGDGLRDDEEAAFDGSATDPTRADTDGDGFSDAVEQDEPLLDPLVPNARLAPEVECVYTAVPWACSREFTIDILDADGDLLSAFLDPEDGSPFLPLGQPGTPGTPYSESFEPEICFDGNYLEPRGRVIVQDALGEALVYDCDGVTP